MLSIRGAARWAYLYDNKFSAYRLLVKLLSSIIVCALGERRLNRVAGYAIFK